MPDNAMVLVVDDDPEFREIVLMALTRAGFTALAAANAPNALAMLAKIRPSLILVDVMMPGMSGPDFVREVEKNGWVEPGRIIMISALAQRCASPAKWCLTKPLDLDLMLRVVQEFCGVGGAGLSPMWKPQSESTEQAPHSVLGLAPGT